MWPLNSLELNPLNRQVWKKVRDLSQAPSKIEDITELKETLQITSNAGYDRQSSKRF